MKILERINSLRGLTRNANIDAYIINGNDPHLSEYVPQRYRTREWISGFTGSYGRVVVTKDKAALWTDSRYFLQAEDQLRDSTVVLMKDRQADTIPYEDWILNELPQNGVVGIDGETLSASEERKLTSKFGAKGIIIKKEPDLVSQIWADRPSLPRNEIKDYPVRFAGITRPEKFKIIRENLIEKRAEGTIISTLDDLAWSFNIRGSDIEYNPVAIGYGYINRERSVLFIDSAKLTLSIKSSLTTDGVEIFEYEDFIPFIKSLKDIAVYLDPERTNCLIYSYITSKTRIIDGPSIPMKLKSVKNEAEILGMRNSHRRDGFAMIHFLFWLDGVLKNQEITELDILHKLKEFRSRQKYYVGDSFYPIVGYEKHGAIVHYHVTDETNSVLNPRGLLLIDSGGQYLDGTTDITRTISLGGVTEQQKKDFTLVLKGMINLAKAVFPVNCKGNSLDILARKSLWDNFMDYGHGTGHGVGHFLCVHEGPVSIRPDNNQEPIAEGCILSNEPGLYREGEYGIRTENLILCKKESQTKFGSFLSFESLTLCPIDKNLIDKDLLNMEEYNWINEYHQTIIDEIGPELEPEVFEWLQIQCSPI